MTSIIRIKYAIPIINDEKNIQSEGTENEILINIDCPLQLILNYIRNVVGLDDTTEIDLCDEINCQLRKVSFFEPRTPGFNVFQADLIYLIVTYERDVNGQMINLVPLLSGKAAKRCSDILSKSHTLVKKNSLSKSSIKKDNNTVK
ncbi:uncharacterized protein CXorf65 homolog [Osmia lignaria lignaria]|uniref:uncharacterized protein CXorf65 homolog n=1 Tax=Osmia lignaria lignaria TaxID=1437193 RepID=UPI001478D1FC|nr:uncharacterized protein CXorf65 homolog [Osmia lignaria]